MESARGWQRDEDHAGELCHARSVPAAGPTSSDDVFRAARERTLCESRGDRVGNRAFAGASSCAPGRTQASRGGMSHQETYRHNEAYAEFLAGWDATFYAKYADALKPAEPGARVLDVGCGVGQVVARLAEAGFEAYGVDVSDPNIERAKKFCPRCQLYDGRKLPFADAWFASTGALNVLEHVEEPEAFIK